MDKFIPHGDPQREQNLADWHYKSHPATKNPDGSPRVFYHGTKDNSMINFSAPNEPIGRRKIEKDDGAFFTDDPSIASLYAGDNVGHIFPVYLSLPENELSTFDLYTKKGINHVYDTLKKSRVELPYDGDRKSFVEYYHNYASPIKLRDDFAEHWAQYSPYPIRFLMGKNESHYQVFNVNQIKSATGNRGTFDPNDPDITKGDGGEVDGITAYHGSPHEFEQFDTSKIGTGEGAQAFGHGLYFAEAEPVAKEYRDALQNPTISVKGKEFPLASQAANEIYPYEDLSYPENINWSEVLYPIHHALTKMQNYDMGLDEAVDDMRSNYSHYKPEYIEKAEQLIRSVKPEIKNKGHMYEVHIDAHPDHFLDWDKPLSEQSEYVKNALANHTPLQKNRPYKPEDTGRDVYYKNTQGLGQKIASNELMSLGIHGIKYLDAGSRGPLASWSTDKLTHNYVVFDHDRVNIKRRYAEGGEVEREGFGFGGDTVGAGSRPERGATGSAVAARQAPVERSYRDMPAELQQAQHDLSFKNERVINAMKEANAADKQQKAEQMTAWAGAGFPAGGPASMQVGEETRPTAYAMSDISKKSPVMQPQADIIASLAPPPQHYESSIAGNQIAAAPIPQRFEPTIAQNQIAAAPMPQHYEPTFAQNRIDPAPQQVAFKQPARPISPTPVNKPIQLASLDSSTFKPASPMPDFQPQQPQGGKGRRRLVKKLMPDGTYQDVWEEYAHGGVAKYHSNHHNPAIVEYALNKISAPPPALDHSLLVAKRGRPF